MSLTLPGGEVRDRINPVTSLSPFMAEPIYGRHMDEDTYDFYENRSEGWLKALPEGHSRFLDPFLDRLQPDARILELGCGDGRDSAHIIERGFHLLPTDGSPRLAKLAGQRIGRKVAILRFEDLQAEQSFDAVWAHAALLHVPLEQLPDVIARIVRALKPGGWHFANFKGGTGGARDEHGRFYNYIPETDLRAAYAAAGGWSDFALETYEDGSFGGQRMLWHAVTARRAIRT